MALLTGQGGSDSRPWHLRRPASHFAREQRPQQSVGGVRAFLPTITVTDSESLLPEIPELPNLEDSSAE